MIPVNLQARLPRATAALHPKPKRLPEVHHLQNSPFPTTGACTASAPIAVAMAENLSTPQSDAKYGHAVLRLHTICS